MNIDIDAREADGIGSLTLAAKLRAVFLQARGDDSAVILAQLVDIEAGNQVSVSVFESAGCSEPFIELATMPFSRVRRVHAVSPRDPAIAEWVIVGDDVEGVVLLAVEDGIAEVVRRWDVAAIDAVLMVPEAGGERAAVIAVPEPPFLRWEPL